MTPGIGRPDSAGHRVVVRPDEHEPIGIDPLAQLPGRHDARHDGHAVGPVLGEDAQRQPLADEVALAGDDHHAIAGVAGLTLEGRRDLAVDGVAQVGQQEAQRARPPDPQAARGGIRDVVELERRGLDGLARGRADARVVGQGA